MFKVRITDGHPSSKDKEAEFHADLSQIRKEIMESGDGSLDTTLQDFDAFFREFFEDLCSSTGKSLAKLLEGEVMINDVKFSNLVSKFEENIMMGLLDSDFPASSP
mmetsp:Transcript_23945/g.36679  ORF Transcript_23945/g.36679 Transcript_23945/m.36679 type:complete len:106 (-) Transcript_23945:3875-4192(-)|eukprot:CAMPEP_0170496266 /NCGR_PEP_ID=MMETSP0208-20121228/20794_1 /TAXON_ID=197538 /ORGANISM="Strombidium inclinatum, Strain S3" /LENGTH=105 /DNA_ID=CAMNT_0010772763 /DNA_START=410 /DNA_END=727 /DNA_ORIENTATION=+